MPTTSLPQDLLSGSFTDQAARDLGVTRKRQRRPDVVIPSRGIRVPLNGNGDPAANLRAYTELDGVSVLTHHSGARIWGCCLPAWMQEDWRVHVARKRDGSKPRRRNVVGHRMTFKAGEVVMHDGVRVTSPARTWLDLASLMTVDELIAAGDSLVCAHGSDFPRPKEAVCTVAELRRMVAAHPGMRGMKTARLALTEIRVGADSPQETRMRMILAGSRLGEPTLNYVITNAWGQPAVWPDAAYPKQRLALQYDGGHHADARQIRSDARRRDVTEQLGWREVRVFKEDLDGDKPFVLEKVKAAMDFRDERQTSAPAGS